MKQTLSRSEKSKYWRSQVALAERFPGSIASFCNEQNISLHTFNYWRIKFRKKDEPAKALNTRPFIEVQVDRPQSMNRKPQLPNAIWLAEFIMHLQRGLQ